MRIIHGDITQTDCIHIIHGCNNRGVFGAGVAKAIAKKWPAARDEYMKEYFLWKCEPPLGSFSIFETEDGKKIFNLVTQDGYGHDGKKYARYWAITEGIVNIIRVCIDTDKAHEIAIPMIGCGLGGLDWSIMEKLLIEIENDFNIEFWVYKL